MKLFFTFLISLVFLLPSCTERESPVTKDVAVKKKFDLYERSEMATVMLYMYEFNRQLKAKIENDETLLAFPDGFERIFKATLTDGHTRDDFFKVHATSFLAHQKAIHDNPENSKQAFNLMVSSCIACHEVKCHGPIPKIEKLYIKE